MKQLTCEMCGSTELVKQDGFFVCQTCGTKYSVEEAKKMMIEGTVEVQGTVKIDKSKDVRSLLNRMFKFIKEGDIDKAEEYCEKILDIDSENPEAYLGKLMLEFSLESTNDFTFYTAPDIEESENYIEMSKYANKKILDLLNKRKKNIETPYIIEDGCLVHVHPDLKEIIIPDSVEMIGINFGCTSLTQVTLPNSVKKIDRLAFEGCTSLTQITIPNSVLFICEGAFKGCTSLAQVTIPNSVKRIDRFAFEGCTSLTQVTIPDSVKEIDNCAFKGCTSLTQVTIPDSVESIGDYAFIGCTSLAQVTISSSSNINLSRIWRHTFIDCDSLTHVKLSRRLWDYDYNQRKIQILLSSAKNINTLEFYDGKKISVKRKDGNLVKTGGCYVATCVYGSYDCPQVWTLRRYRDDTLGATWYGRLFIRTYYAISPTLVKWFGDTNWFKKMWKGKLDRMVAKLQSNGVEDTPYEDKAW